MQIIGRTIGSDSDAGIVYAGKTCWDRICDPYFVEPTSVALFAATPHIWRRVSRGEFAAWEGLHDCVLGVVVSLGSDRCQCLAYDYKKSVDSFVADLHSSNEFSAASDAAWASGKIKELSSFRFPEGKSTPVFCRLF